MGKFSGRNILVESVAALLFSKCGLGGNLQTQEQESISFTFMNNIDSVQTATENIEPTKKSYAGSDASGADDILVDTDGQHVEFVQGCGDRFWSEDMAARQSLGYFKETRKQ